MIAALSVWTVAAYLAFTLSGHGVWFLVAVLVVLGSMFAGDGL